MQSLSCDYRRFVHGGNLQLQCLLVALFFSISLNGLAGFDNLDVHRGAARENDEKITEWQDAAVAGQPTITSFLARPLLQRPYSIDS